MRIDIVLEPNASAQKFAELGALAESYGIGAVWTANHLAARDPFLCFSLLGAATNTIGMGPVAISPFELHPVKMANALLTLNEMSNGRASIVIGGGGGSMMFMGIERKRMVKAVEECVEFIKGASADDALTFKGEIYQVANYHPKWVKDTPPLLYVAASRDRMLRMAGRVADGVMMTDITLFHADDAIKAVRKSLAQSSRSPEAFRINNLFAWHVKEDKEEAIGEARRKLLVRGGVTPWYVSPFLSQEDCDIVQDHMPSFLKAYAANSPIIEDVPDRIIDDLIEHLTLTGDLADLDTFIEKLKKFEAAGFNEFALRIYDEPEKSIKLIGEQVVPVFS